MKTVKVLISTSSFGQYDKLPIEKLKKKGIQVELNPHGRKLTEAEITLSLKDVDYLIAGTEPITENVLKSAKKLKVISRCGVGMDNIDLLIARELGIKVCNTPFGPTLAVAELTIGLMINMLRNINQMDRNMRSGKWQKIMGNLLSKKHIGIIGFGRIGQKVAELLLPFNVKIRYFDINEISCRLESEQCDLKTLLMKSDIISIHTSFAKEPIIGRDELKFMSEKSWLINMTRGGIVDESALFEALKEKRISGAALDVFDKEPYSGDLLGLKNVIVTPHVGSYAKEARQQMEEDAVSNLLNLIDSIE